jgi:hypothetical protein
MKVLDMAYDNAASIYMVGWCDPGYTKYFTDTTVTNPNYSMYLMKYDTSGHFRWIRFLGANNAANQLQTWGEAHSVAVDAQGNPHYIVNCKTGMEITPIVTTQAGTYDVKYSASGLLISTVRLPLDSLWQIKRSLIVSSGAMYTVAFHNLLSAYNYALIKLDAARNILWSDSTGKAGGISSFTFDKANGIYVAGDANGGQTFQFANLSASNAYYPGYGYAILCKVDTNGTGKWLVHYDCSQSAVGFYDVQLMPNGTLAAAGLFAGTLRRGTDSVFLPMGQGQDPFILIADTAGNTITLDQLHGTGFYDWATAGAADKSGNFYIGGQFESNITAAGLGAGISSTGGNTDFFIMKYGYNCNCNAPAAHFNAGAPSGKTVAYTYTGTTAGLDSLVWSFGDGQTKTVKSSFTAPVTHTFIANGRFNVCVTAYSSCGSNTHCDQTALSVSGMAALEGVKVYPNPASEVLTVEGAAGADFILSNHIGQQVLQGHIRSQKEGIRITALPAGTYLLQLTDEKGQRGVMMVMKQ